MTITLDTLFSATGYCVVRPIAVVAFGTERAMLLDKLYQLLHEPPNDVEVKMQGGRRHIRISAQWLRKRRSFWFWKPRNIQTHISLLVKDKLIIQLPPEKNSPDRRRWTALDEAKLVAYARERMIRYIEEERDFVIQDTMRNALRMHAQSAAGHAQSRSSDHAQSTAHLQYKETRNIVPKEAQPEIRNPLFDAIAELCVLDQELNGKEIALVADALQRIEATPEKINTFKAWWESDEWRMDHTPTPTLKQLTRDWKKAMEGIKPKPKASQTKNAKPSANGKHLPGKPTDDPNIRVTKNGVRVWVGPQSQS